MKNFEIFYSDGSELLKGDIVLINGKKKGQIEGIILPGTKEASDYSCDEGGFIVVFEDGDVQVWPDADEDIQLVQRGDG